MRGIFIRAPWIFVPGPVSRSWGMSTAEWSQPGRGRSWRSHFTPSWGMTIACTGLFLELLGGQIAAETRG